MSTDSRTFKKAFIILGQTKEARQPGAEIGGWTIFPIPSENHDLS